MFLEIGDMTKQETEMIIRVLEAAYPGFYRNKTADDRREALRLWHDMFAEDSGTMVGAAVKAYIATSTSGFPPDIGQIKQRLVRLRYPDMLDEAQAWALVSKAIGRSTYHAAEEFEKLPSVVRRVVGNPAMLKSWAMSNGDELQTVVASNFQRAYRARAVEVTEYLALPGEIQKLLAMQGAKELPQEADGEELRRDALRMLEGKKARHG